MDDHPLFREALIARLQREPSIGACHEADTVSRAKQVIAAEAPSLLVIDLNLEGGSGLDLVHRIHAAGDLPRILVITGLDGVVYAERVLRAGAQGFISMSETPERILAAIHTVLNGGLFIPQDVANLFVMPAARKNREKSGVESLSDRELEIFAMLGKGKGTREIADELDLSPHTVESHRERIRLKLGLKNSIALVRRAFFWSLEEAGLADPPRS